MMDAVLHFVHTIITSPWFYLVMFALAAVDAFFPAVLSESVVITAGPPGCSPRAAGNPICSS
ncbi:hypothetical protein [Pseudonocardia nigra]|uniref:hypothetical protein n=1 Tax=Pseudonocardia nigra TaxID=1921578 RepID=UPI001C5D46DB|nr:hypothetical protein [Pseudonocardia nigra]